MNSTIRNLLHLVFCSTAILSFVIRKGISAAECGEPPHVLHAVAEVSPHSSSLFLNGTTIYYSCMYGYGVLPHVNATAMCVNENGVNNWKLEPFKCEPDCEELPVLPHVSFNLEVNVKKNPPFFSGDSVTYICDAGYVADTLSPKAVCDNRNWIMPIEPCRAKSCGYPGDIENALRIGSSLTFPNNVTYVCKEGFKLVGNPTLFCSASGAWIPQKLPHCEAVICPILSELENGKVFSTDRRYRAIGTYACNKGYHLKGSVQRICQTDGTWDGSMPTCVETTCLYPGPLPNGRVIRKQDVYKVGDIVVFQCNFGQKTKSSKCTDDGSWNHRPPVCEAPPTTHSPATTSETTESPFDDLVKSNSCDDPGDIRNGKKFITGFTPGNNVTYSCEADYTIRGETTLICLPSGKWNYGKLPICVKPIPIATIVGIVIGILLTVFLGICGFLFYRWRERKLRGYGKKKFWKTAMEIHGQEILKKSKIIQILCNTLYGETKNSIQSLQIPTCIVGQATTEEQLSQKLKEETSPEAKA